MIHRTSFNSILKHFNSILKHCYKLFLILLIPVVVSCSDDNDAEPQSEIAVEDAVLLEIIDIAEANSINRLTINWDTLQKEVFEVFADSGSRRDAISRFLTLLGDNHSLYLQADGTFIGADEREIFCSLDNVTISESPDDYGYVKVSGFGGSTEEGNEFASAIQDSIAAGAATQPSKWVVDLTENTGGNMYPMIAGLGPFFGNGILGYFIDPLGEETAWGYINGSSWVVNAGVTLNTVTDPFQFEIQPKVAVIIDSSTASSGEATLISFIGRPDTRIFGLASCGLSTANAGFSISNGDQLILTVSDMADRSKNVYGVQVNPDETFDDSASLKERVIEWLNE